MNNEDDIYNDLPEETTSDYITKIENKLDSLQKQYDDSQRLIKELSIEKHNQQKRIKELMKKIEDLERNISSLYKTAVAETKRKDSMLHELRAENDDLAFRRREYRARSTNYHRSKSRDHSKGITERYRRNDSSNEKKYGHRSRVVIDSTFHMKKLVDRKSEYNEKPRIDKRSSSERNELPSSEFQDQEKYHRSRAKCIAVKERHSRSSRDRIENPSALENHKEIQNSEYVVKNERRRSRERHPKSQIKSVIKKEINPINLSTRLDNSSAVINGSEPQNLAISNEDKNFCNRIENALSIKNGTHKPSMLNLHKIRNDRVEITSTTKNETHKSNTLNLDEIINNRIENTSSVKNDTTTNTSNLNKDNQIENTSSLRNAANEPNISNLDKNDQIQNTPNVKNDTSKSNITNPNENKYHFIEEKHPGSVDNPNNLAENAPSKILHKTPAKNLIQEILDQRNSFIPCEAALLSMKKQPWKLLTPMKDTPDCLKEKFTQIENNKINAKVPMINEQRMLSPFKNVGIVEIVSRHVDEAEPTKSSQFETITTCSVTISEDVEHGVFSRKNRKRPRIQKIVTSVKKVAVC